MNELLGIVDIGEFLVRVVVYEARYGLKIVAELQTGMSAQTTIAHA